MFVLYDIHSLLPRLVSSPVLSLFFAPPHPRIRHLTGSATGGSVSVSQDLPRRLLVALYPDHGGSPGHMRPVRASLMTLAISCRTALLTIAVFSS